VKPVAGTVSRDRVIRFPAQPRTCRVHIHLGALDRVGTFTRLVTGATRAALVSDANVAALYAPRALRSLARAGIHVSLVTVPPGERSKAVRHLTGLWDVFSCLELDRGAAVVALGGGVVGDLSGFASATWLRGLQWVCVPTSLLAQVDSSVGGKTAIDLGSGKNLVGAFHQPSGVLVDPDTLATLPARHLQAGLAELVKTGMAVDAELFAWTERNAGRLLACDSSAMEAAVARAMRAKARIVSRDERERRGGRTALNYGHTVAHALEAVRGYRGLLHGEAVAIGMRAASALSARCAGLPPGERARLVALLDVFGLPKRMPPTPLQSLLAAMSQDKKRLGAAVRWVLTPRVGHASLPRLIPNRMVEEALLEAGARIASFRGP
jgi:3-dehydroquinate synthase